MGFPECGKTLIRGAGGGIDLPVDGSFPQNHSYFDFESSYQNTKWNKSTQP